MFYTIYKITNLINGKYYIGKHQTKRLDDGYMGSGKVLKHAIKKYGIENFKKEILHIFDNEQEMNAKEKELVVVNEQTYNLNEGGKGGFSYINRILSGKEKRIYKAIAAWLHLAKTDPVWNQKRIAKISKSRKKNRHKSSEFMKNYYKDKPGTFKGKRHSTESKQKISQANKGRAIGQKNSQFGTIWITNGISNRKVNIEDRIPAGWKKGRILGKIWITNGTLNKIIPKDDEIPDGWTKGRVL